MLVKLLDRLLDLRRDEHVEINDIVYSTHQLHVPVEPTVNTLRVNTLTGIVDFIKNNRDKLDLNEYSVHVIDYNLVQLISATFGQTKGRDVEIKSLIDSPCNFKFGRRYDMEQFIIELQTNFVPTEDLKRILLMVGNVTNERVVTSEDDGVTQRVGMKVGAKLNLKGNADVPNPVTLRPYRTFLEIEQPASKFVFRVHQGEDGELPEAGLYAADGGLWRLEAIQSIKKWLEERVTEVPVIA